MASDGSAAPQVGRPSRRQFGLLSASFLCSSALGMALLVVVARWLTPTENAHFQVVWGLVFAFGSVLGAIEQDVVRRAAASTLDGHRVPLGAVQSVALASLACVVVLAGLLATPSGRVMVAGSAPVVTLTFLSLPAFAGLILTRGVLLGRHAVSRYAVLILGESVVRLVVLGILVVRGVEPSVEWAVLATVLGGFVWLGLVGSVVRGVDWAGPRDAWRTAGGTVAALAASNGLAAMVLTGFPAVASVMIGDPAGLAVLFGVVTLARAPLVLLAPVQALVVPTVVRWSRSGASHRLARALRQIGLASAGVALAAGAVGYAVGPWAVELVLGALYRPPAAVVAIVAAATCVMAAALIQAAALVALGRAWQLAGCWALAIALSAALMLAAPVSAEQRGTAGFAAASLVAFLATALAVGRSTRDVAHGDGSASY